MMAIVDLMNDNDMIALHGAILRYRHGGELTKTESAAVTKLRWLVTYQVVNMPVEQADAT